jgi:hypothetical protein
MIHVDVTIGWRQGSVQKPVPHDLVAFISFVSIQIRHHVEDHQFFGLRLDTIQQYATANTRLDRGDKADASTCVRTEASCMCSSWP